MSENSTELDAGPTVIDVPVAASSPKKNRRTPGGRRRPPVDKALVARVAGKLDQVVALSPAERDALALLLGDPGMAQDTVALVTGALSGPREAAATVELIEQQRGLDPFEAGASATALALESRPRLRAAWLLVAGVADLPKEPPANAAKAGLLFARAVASLTDRQLAALSAPLGLLD